ncbi:MAG: hypothetical protein RLZZ399_1081 [Verrucomicrobiota bacterium]|jgi:hypothetical protein
MSKMTIRVCCPRWGAEHLAPKQFIQKVIQAGYEGIEVGIADHDEKMNEVLLLAREHGLLVIAQHYVTTHRDVDVHIREYEGRLRRIVQLQPDKINSQTGRDIFDLKDNLRIFEIADRIQQESGIPVLHETHRSRWMHCAWRTAEMVERLPTVQIALDASHWCCGSESLLEDQMHWIEAVVPHVGHVHARVGWQQGAQVSDPRAPEWAGALEAHLKWWDRTVEFRRSQGCAELTFTPEFGPVPYMPVLPYTQEPVADQWEINVFMMQLLRSRYGAKA